MRKNKLIYIIIFAFFLAVCFLNPIVGDDWWNYPVGKQGISYIFNRAIEMYFTWEGRFVSRLLINILTCHKVLWNFINALVVTGIIYLINRNVKNRNKISVLLSAVLIFTFMHPYMFFQTITWVAGNITYMFVIPIILYYVFLITKDDINNYEYAILIISSIFGTMYVENLALVIVFLNLVYFFSSYIIDRKINYKALILLVLSLSSASLMILSPGSRSRAIGENVYFNGLNLIGKMRYNVHNLVKYTYFTNYYMVLLAFIGNILLIKNKFKNKLMKSFLYFFEILLIVGPSLYLLKGVNIIANNVFSEYNRITIIIYSLLTLINFVLLVINNKNYLRDRSILLYSIGILSNVVMLVSPTWGPRTALGTYIFLSASYIIVIDKYMKRNRIFNCCLALAVVFSMLFYGTISVSIHRQYKENYAIVQDAVASNSETIYLKSYPSYVMNSINPKDEFHQTVFKEYYGIDSKTKLELVPNNWKYSIFYK